MYLIGECQDSSVNLHADVKVCPQKVYMLGVGVLVASVIVLHLPGLHFISHLSCHFCNLIRSFWNKEESQRVLIGVHIKYNHLQRAVHL